MDSCTSNFVGEMNKNRKLLMSFVNYCAKHPEERFWQALRNWSGFLFIYALEPYAGRNRMIDTFYFEGKDK